MLAGGEGWVSTQHNTQVDKKSIETHSRNMVSPPLRQKTCREEHCRFQILRTSDNSIVTTFVAIFSLTRHQADLKSVVPST